MAAVRYLSFEVDDLPVVVEQPEGVPRLRLSRSSAWGEEMALAYEMLAGDLGDDASLPGASSF